MIRVMRAATLTADVESEDGLDVAMAARRRIAQTEAAKCDAILSYLDVAGAEPLAQHSRTSEWVRYGGSGTPAVSEFSVSEVGPALGLTTNGGRALIADTLDLAYRLPQLFSCLHDGSVDAWRVRKVASATRKFTLAQAGEADRRLSAANLDGQPLLARIPRWRIQKLLDQIRIVETPDDAEDERNQNRDRRFLQIWPSEPGVASISGTLSTEDGQRLDQRLDQIVECLQFLGDPRPHTMLRSVAAGILAEPDSLFDLYDHVDHARNGTEPDQPTPEPEQATPAEPENASNDEPEPNSQTAAQTAEPESTGNAEPTGSQAGRAPAAFTRPRRLPSTVLYMHFDRTWGTYSLDGIGAITCTEAHEILGHSRVTVRPVIDLESTITATGYVASPRLKQQTALFNDGTCTFPSCDRPARVCDYDHILNHRNGGATDSRNGHRLCRYHHRAKTFTDWHVTSPAPGVWVWTSPDGRTYLVTGGTTTRLPGRVPNTHQRRRKHDAA